MNKNAIRENYEKLKFYVVVQRTGGHNSDNYYYCKLPNNEFVNICTHRHQSLSWPIKPVYIFLENNLDITTGIYLDERSYACTDENFLDKNGVYIKIDRYKDCLVFATVRPDSMDKHPEKTITSGDLRMFLLTGIEL